MNSFLSVKQSILFLKLFPDVQITTLSGSFKYILFVNNFIWKIIFMNIL